MSSLICLMLFLIYCYLFNACLFGLALLGGFTQRPFFSETFLRDFTQRLFSETFLRDFSQRLFDFTQRLFSETFLRDNSLFSQRLFSETFLFFLNFSQRTISLRNFSEKSSLRNFFLTSIFSQRAPL